MNVAIFLLLELVDFEVFVKYDITTPKRIVAFITQAAVQTDNFTALVEYTTCPNATWPYGYNRYCTTYPGGCEYKGRGIMQIHGENDYRAASNHAGINFLSKPCYLSKKTYSFDVSGYFWASNGMNVLAESGDWNLMTQRITQNQPELLSKRLSYLDSISHCYRPPISDTSKCGFTYTCTDGDTIDTITTRYRMLPTEIYAVNNIPQNYTGCNAGQKLYIPMLC